MLLSSLLQTQLSHTWMAINLALEFCFAMLWQASCSWGGTDCTEHSKCLKQKKVCGLPWLVKFHWRELQQDILRKINRWTNPVQWTLKNCLEQQDWAPELRIHRQSLYFLTIRCLISCLVRTLSEWCCLAPKYRQTSDCFCPQTPAS